jgi:hypothetical protein
MKYLFPLGVLLAFSTAYAQHYPEGLMHQPSLRYLIQDKGIPFELREFKEHAEGKRPDGDGGDSIAVAGNYSKYRAMIVLEDLKPEAPEAEWVAVLDGSDPKGWLKIRKAQPYDLIIKKWSCETHHAYKTSNFDFEQRSWNLALERIEKFEMPFFKGPDGKLKMIHSF